MSDGDRPNGDVGARAASGAAHGVALLMMPAGSNRDALKAALAGAGFSVLAFGSAMEVAPHLYGIRPAVVLVDSINGPTVVSQVVAWLHLAGVRSPVVAMGNMTAEFTGQVNLAGVEHCVPYPADVGVFAAQVVLAARAGNSGT